MTVLTRPFCLLTLLHQRVSASTRATSSATPTAISTSNRPGSAAAPAHEELALFEMIGGNVRSDRFDALSIKDALIEIKGLAAGDYDLWLKRTGERIRIRVVDGNVIAGHVLGKLRHMQLPALKPVQLQFCEFHLHRGVKRARIEASHRGSCWHSDPRHLWRGATGGGTRGIDGGATRRGVPGAGKERGAGVRALWLRPQRLHLRGKLPDPAHPPPVRRAQAPASDGRL